VKETRPEKELDTWKNFHPQITQITRDFFQIIAAKDVRLRAKVSDCTNGKMDKESYKREFERLSIDFVLEVSAESIEGN